jgi:hypothetical protein
LTSILRCNNCKTIERANQVLFYSKRNYKTKVHHNDSADLKF